MAEPLGILLISGSHERAHYAFVLAAGAAALGREVTLFATNLGCRALLADWTGLEGADRDERVQARGVAGLEVLRQACVELGVGLLVCEAGLKAEAIEARFFDASVEVAGVAGFLAAVGPGQIVSL